MPRLLFLTHRFPYPPNRGDRIRSYNMLRVLAERFEVTLACPHDEPVTTEQLQHVQQYCSAVHTVPTSPARWFKAGCSALAGLSLTEGLFASRSLQQSILKDHQRQPFDSILVFCSSMFPYVDHEAFQSVRKVVDLVDVDSMKWQQLSKESLPLKRPVYALETQRVRKLERRIADQADAITLVSNDEAKLFQSIIPTTTPVLGISNGVDTDYFRPCWATSPNKDGSRGTMREARGARNGVEGERDEERGSRREVRDTSKSLADSTQSLSSSRLDPRPSSLATSHSPLATSDSPPACRMVFTGVLDYPPNVEGMRWFCREILPRLRKQGDFELSIVGRRANATVQKLAGIDGVDLVGEVPDVRPYLHAADIAISPLKLARGIQNKVLEAMACGLPVVTTTQSAEGIDAIDGNEFVIADSVEQWCRELIELATAPSRRQQIGTEARDLVFTQYSWESKLRQVATLLGERNEVRAARNERLEARR